MKTLLGHPRLPIALLAGVIALVTVCDWLFNLSFARMSPFLVEQGWDMVRMGDFSGWSLWWLLTTVTYAFLHGDAEHLLGNMLFFWIFGSVILELCGWRWLLGTFFLTALGGALGHIMMEQESFIPMLGASGTVMGFEGAYLGLVVRKPRPDPFVWPMAHPISPGTLAAVGVVGVVLDVMGILSQSPGAGIAYGAHIGGFVTGIFVSFLRRD